MCKTVCQAILALIHSSYSGDVCNGLRHGVGTYIDKNGVLTYTGEWVNGKRQGKVTIMAVQHLSISPCHVRTLQIQGIDSISGNIDL